ncbi:hypothetical protein BS50DRAFT_680100 [Corynespora cassiicola Philippines]|uniref:Uncharacterized protein n=1 Tax=Corynespora cassiicola Philippines TaxID=1448308 RepID=A0A2T2NBC9_CORCC|nr:hypothetical protein BS50DRAFT_680100 [Corynespora cassiicola Philippines]
MTSNRDDEVTLRLLSKDPGPLIYLNAYPGTGKLTVCQELAKLLGPSLVTIVDNHTLANPVARRLFPNDIEYEMEKQKERQHIFDEIVESENKDVRGKVVVMTDFQIDNKLGRSVTAEFAEAAERAGRLFVPIVLTCSLEENIRRITSENRRHGRTAKLIDPGTLGAIRCEHESLMFEQDGDYVLDVSDMAPQKVARKIVYWAIWSILIGENGRAQMVMDEVYHGRVANGLG